MQRAMEGYIKHVESGKFIHPKCGNCYPPNGNRLVIWSSDSMEFKLKVRFIPIEGEGQYGYIEHCASRKLVHPVTGLATIKNGTELVYHSDRHVGCLFKFDEENKTIQHRGGKFWHPKSGFDYPDQGTCVVLWDGVHKNTHFIFVDGSNNQISPLVGN